MIPTAASLRARDLGIVRHRLAREQREGLGQQAVADQDGHAVAEDDVRGRPAAPHRVVVHGRQVVVDERVGVDQLDGAGGRQGERVRACCRRLVDALQRPRGSAADAAACRRRRRCSAAPSSSDLGTRGAARQHADQRRFDQRAARVDPHGERRRARCRRTSRHRASPSGSDEPGAGRTSPRSVSTSMRRSASSSLRVTEARQLHAALEQRERLLQREVALFELRHDGLELGERGFEIVGRFAHPSSRYGFTRPGDAGPYIESFRRKLGRHSTASAGLAAGRCRSLRKPAGLVRVARARCRRWRRRPGCAEPSARPSAKHTAYPRPSTASGLRVSSRPASVRTRTSARWPAARTAARQGGVSQPRAASCRGEPAALIARLEPAIERPQRAHRRGDDDWRRPGAAGDDASAVRRARLPTRVCTVTSPRRAASWCTQRSLARRPAAAAPRSARCSSMRDPSRELVLRGDDDLGGVRRRRRRARRRRSRRS